MLYCCEDLNWKDASGVKHVVLVRKGGDKWLSIELLSSIPICIDAMREIYAIKLFMQPRYCAEQIFYIDELVWKFEGAL